LSAAPTSNRKLLEWVEEVAAMTTPERVVWCDGSRAEYEGFCAELVESGTMIPLDSDLRPESFLQRSDPRDTARVESRTFICSERAIDAGPNNNWTDPNEMREKLVGLFRGSMRGRTMYVVPFIMGPIGSQHAKAGVEITDSPSVAANMSVMTRMGTAALAAIGDDGSFIPCLHSVGAPLEPGEKDVSWPCDPENTYIVHFPETREIWSYGSGYGGNALLGKKCLALRIASVVARDEGWLAEHMLIMKVTAPDGESRYIAGAFPSACGKTNLAMMIPTLPGWKIETIGDDICWMQIGDDGRLWAVNPESGFFGVAPGTGKRTNPNALTMLSQNAIFTNAALTDAGDIWWEGLTNEPPAHLVDWKGNDWTPESETTAAHPNARFTVPIAQDPAIAPEWDDPAGVPISALLFGGRRSSVVPLVHESFDWSHGVFLGAIMSSETTAAATGEVGRLRHDPFAMLPFCGYNMADYWAHWLSFTKRLETAALPKVFYVNWFRKDVDGRFLWPGFGENSRVIAWIFERCCGRADADRSPIGWLPAPGSIDTDSLDLKPGVLDELFAVDASDWRAEAKHIRDYFGTYGDHVPTALYEQLDALEERLDAS
jgi:phosphoenolpyruvate carboxykinase (GTP)